MNQKQKIAVVIFIVGILAITGIGIGYYSQTIGDTSTINQKDSETVPSDVVQYINNKEVTKTISTTGLIKIKEIQLDEEIESFKVKSKMHTKTPYKRWEISNNIQFSDNEVKRHSDFFGSWTKLKEIEVDQPIKKARFYFEMKADWGRAIAEIRVNGNDIGKDQGGYITDYKKFVQDLTGLDIEKGDKIQLWVKPDTSLIFFSNTVSVRNFQIRYDYQEGVTVEKIDYQIRSNEISLMKSWKTFESKEYKEISQIINTGGIPANNTIEIWIKGSLETQVSIKDMKLCYS
jgi:hypothetical protein